MVPTVQPNIYDATVELTDDYTNLLTRPKARTLIKSLRERLSHIPDGEVLVLDFASVASIDHSFLDEFLIPVLRDIRAGKFGERLLAGANFDSSRLDKESINNDLVAAGTPLLVLDRLQNPIWFGISDPLEHRILQQVYSAGSETLEHVQVLLYRDQATVQKVLDDLVSKRLIKRESLPSIGVENIVPAIDMRQNLRAVGELFVNELKERVYSTIERGCHYELSPSVHASEYLHLSKVFSDARLVSRIAMTAGELCSSKPPEVVLTVCTPSALVFGHRLAEYFGADCVFADVDEHFIAHLAPGLQLPSSQAVLISIDVLSTGTDIKALLELMRPHPQNIVGICAAVDVSGGSVTFPPFRMTSVLTLALKQYQAWQCPMCRMGVPLRSASKIHLGLRR